ncbi:MAG: Aspartate ammonia-lyase [candidate division WS2 bacterium]|nr:Aspartate ammonia-lyase [Candidatus Psychracetigena formicireducens]
MRIEKDLLGEKEIPQEAYYGIHTVRARENFLISGIKVHPELIKALAMIKKAAVLTNMELGYLSKDKGQAIKQAAEEIMRGQLLDQFIVDTIQGGAGTSTNMNMNEVLANRALEILEREKGDYDYLHPNNHVNMCQSTNDVYPTAIRVAAVNMLLPLNYGFANLQEALQQKEEQFAGVIKMGRTQLQDAVPITLGQEFSAYAQAISRDRWRLYKVEERLRQVNLGGTAVGTGINAERKYIFMVNEKLREITGLGLARAENMIDVTQNMDVFVEVSGLLKAAAVNLSKIANDLRLLSSGPRTGLGEINLPERQAGSSIMPGKINPVIPEAINQISFQIISNDLAITLAASAGQLELNVMAPLIAHNLLQSLEILNNGVEIFRKKCILGITANREKCREYLEKSYGLVTALVPYIGYETASEIAKKALAEEGNIKEIALKTGLFTPEELEIILQPQEATHPGISGAKQLKEKLKKQGLRFE